MPKKERTPLTVERIERALQVVAFVISEYGELRYVPLMERIEAELKAFKEARDPIERARAILNKNQKAS